MEAFIEAATAFLALLKSVDVSVHGRHMIRWRLAELSYSSPATIVADGRPSRKETLSDPTPRAAEALLDGIEALERHSPMLPEFSDEVLGYARTLGRLRGEGGIANVTLVGANEVPAAQPRMVSVTQRVAAAVDDVLGAKHRALGSVEGRLEGINIHGAYSLNVFEVVHGKRVRCIFAPQDLEQVKVALGHRVLVMGEVQSSSRGHPVSVKVTKLRLLKERGESPSVEDILRIDRSLTGGVESTQFIRERWDGDEEE
jgi:hypothetical protein